MLNSQEASAQELAERERALEAARSEVECLREMVTGWEEAFGKAQQELESLRVGLPTAQHSSAPRLSYRL